MIKLKNNERVIAVVPDDAGFFGGGRLWIHIVDYSTQTHRQECLHAEQLTDRMRVLFATLEKAHETMKALVMINNVTNEHIQPHGY